MSARLCECGGGCAWSETLQLYRCQVPAVVERADDDGE